MTEENLAKAILDISSEQDVLLKHLKLASICSALFAERGIELVVVGGSAIEFYTEGAYTSGDVDFCIMGSALLTLRQRQEIMGKLGAKGGPRSWEVGGAFVDVLGPFENLARTAIRQLIGPYGPVAVSPVEELIVERVLVSVYPSEYTPALNCAKKIVAAALRDEIECDWSEVKRLAALNAYAIPTQVERLINEQAKALKIRSPYHSDE